MKTVNTNSSYSIPTAAATTAEIPSLSVGVYEKNPPLLVDFVQTAQALAARKADHDIDLSEVSFAHNGSTLLMNVQGALFKTERRSVADCLTRMSPAHFLNTQIINTEYICKWFEHKPDLCVDLLNAHLETARASAKNKERKWVVRTFDDVARFVVSDRYGVIDNAPLVEEFHRLLSGQNIPGMGVVGTSFINRDSMQITVKWQDVGGEISEYGFGTRLFNFEGAGAAKSIAPIVWRSACNNSAQIDVKGLIASRVSVRHFGRDAFATAKSVMVAHIQDALEAGQIAVNQLALADMTPVEVPDFAEFLSDLCKAHKLTDAEKDAAMISTEGRQTVGGIVNAFTGAAHRTEKIGAERATELETIGGSLLFDPRMWKNAKYADDRRPVFADASRNAVHAAADKLTPGQ